MTLSTEIEKSEGHLVHLLRKGKDISTLNPAAILICNVITAIFLFLISVPSLGHYINT